MPFTVSHAAAVLPLRRLAGSSLPLAALMIGSMAPDFAYFLPDPPARVASHSLPGLFLFCLPAGLLAWLVFARLLEGPTLALLPANWGRKFPASDPRLSLRNLALVALAVVLGALTHLLWDAFTHANTFIVNAVPALRAPLYAGSGWKLYGFLQHLSTLVGAFFLLRWAIRSIRSRADAATAGRLEVSNRVRIAAAFVLLVSSSLLAVAGYAAHPGHSVEDRLFYFAIGGMTGWAVAWCAVALCIQARWAWQWRANRATQ